MVIPSLFVRTRWQSKYLMLHSIILNKDIIVSMCDIADSKTDEEYKGLEGAALTDEEWKIVEVRLLLFVHFFLIVLQVDLFELFV